MTVDVGTISLDQAVEMFDPKLAQRAMAQALNAAARQAQTAQSRAVSLVYNVPRGQFKKTLILKRAKPKKIEAVSVSVSRPTELTVYKPRQTGKGIVVAIRRKSRKTIPGGFLQIFGEGRKLVAARRVKGSSVHDSLIKRSKHHGRTIRRGKRKGELIKREALKQIYGPTIAHLADNPEIVKAAFEKIDEIYPGEFEEKLERIYDATILKDARLASRQLS